MPPPLIWPRAGTNIGGLHTTLQNVANELNGLTGCGTEILPTYLTWALQSTSRLQTCLMTEDVDRLIRTPTFWAALQLNPADQQAQYLINIEKEDRRNYINQMVASVAAFQRRFENVPETAFVLVLDTSMVIRYGDAFSTSDWRGLVASDYLRNHDTLYVVLPLLVVDELDGLKDRGKDPARSRARNVLKLVHRLLADHPDGRRTLQEAAGSAQAVTLEVLMESPEHQRLPIADDEIVAVAARLRNALGARVAVASTDTGFDLRASSHDLKHVLVGFD